MTTTTEQTENPPVFPKVVSMGNKSMSEGGMELRDVFASQAVIAVAREYLCRNGFHGDTMAVNIAAHSYKIADAMLRERGK